MANIYFMTIKFQDEAEAQKGFAHIEEGDLMGTTLHIGLGNECLAADFKYAQILADLDDQKIGWLSAMDE